MGAYAGPNISEDGLVLALDAANPKSYPGSGTTWNDLSGNGNNGTLTNMDGTNLDSTNGGSFTFDGTNEYVITPLDGPTTFLPASDFSVSAWVNVSAYSDNTQGTILGSFDYDGYGLFWFVSGNTLTFRAMVRTRAVVITFVLLTTGPIQTNVWYSLAMSHSFSQNFFKLYLNGVEVSASGAIVGGGEYSRITGRNISIGPNWGANGGGTSSYFQGKISNATLYDRALTASEIQQNFNAIRGRFGV